MNPLKWMGAVRMWVQTADNINTTLQSISEHLEKARHKSIKMFETSSCCMQLRYVSIIHDNASSVKKSISCCLSHIELFWLVNGAWSVQGCVSQHPLNATSFLSYTLKAVKLLSSVFSASIFCGVVGIYFIKIIFLSCFSSLTWCMLHSEVCCILNSKEFCVFI